MTRYNYNLNFHVYTVLESSRLCHYLSTVWHKNVILITATRRKHSIFNIYGSMPRESNLIIVFQQDATYSVYYISVGSSTCFGC